MAEDYALDTGINAGATGSTTRSQPTPRREDIQGLRAVAVLAVVLFHAGLPLPGGYLGVDVFFVISGFVIAGLISRQVQTGQFRIWGFYSRRIRRLTPALALVSVIVLLLSIPLLSPIDAQRDVAALAVGGATFTANFVMMIAYGGYFDPQAQFSPLMHLWSLSLEEQFYMLFPFAFVLGARWRGMVGAFVAVTFMAAVSMITSMFALSDMGLALPVNDQAYAFFSPMTRSWEFAVGAMAFLAVKRWPSVSPSSATTRAGSGGLAMLVLFSTFLLTDRGLTPGAATALAVLSTLVLLLVGTESRGGEARRGVTSWLSHPVAVWIGALSYSWYLWHWPAAVFTRVLGGNPILIAVITILSFVPAYLAFRLVEDPIRLGHRVKANSAVILLVCSSTTIALAGLVYLGSARDWGSPQIALVSNQVEPWFLGYENGCAQGPSPTEESALRCTWNESASGSPIYLVGDSNAAMYGDGLLKAAEELKRPLTIMSMPGCSLSELGFADAGLLGDSEPTGCSEYGREIVNWLKGADPGSVVTASARADAALPEPDVTAGDPLNQLANAAAGPLAEIRAAGHQVVYLRTMPSLSRHSDGILWHADECPSLQLMRNPSACGVSWELTELEPEFDAVWQMERNAAQIADADYADLLPAICTEEKCTTNVGTYWRYRDGKHLSVDFSRRLSADLLKAVTEPKGQ